MKAFVSLFTKNEQINTTILEIDGFAEHVFILIGGAPGHSTAYVLLSFKF